MAYSQLINGYTKEELFQLQNDDLRKVTEQGFVKGPDGKPMRPGSAFGLDQVTTQHFQQAAQPQSEFSLGAAHPASPPPQSEDDPYAVTAWNRPREYDFVTPSGQRCLIRKVDQTRLIAAGIIGQVTRLTGVVQEGINAAQGKQASKIAELMQDPSKASEIIDIIDALVISVVVKPELRAVPKSTQRVPGVIYIDSVELADRVAIMEEAMRGVKLLDNFRS